MAEIASAPASPPLALRFPNLSQTLPKSFLQGLVASPRGRAGLNPFGARRSTSSAMHPALPQIAAALLNRHLRRGCAPSPSAAPHERHRRTAGGHLWRRGSFHRALRPHLSRAVHAGASPENDVFAFLGDDLAIDHPRRHPSAVGRLLVAQGTQVSAIFRRYSMHRP